MAKSICIVCGKEDGGIPWQLTPVHPECRIEVCSKAELAALYLNDAIGPEDYFESVRDMKVVKEK